MKKCLIVLLTCLAAQMSQGQLAVPYEEDTQNLPQPPAPEELKEEQQRIEAMTREIQRRTLRMSEQVDQAAASPGKAFFEAVYHRVTSSPGTVRVKVEYQDGTLQVGEIENALFDVENPVGRFPVEWEEISSMTFGSEGVTLRLTGEDTLSGNLILEVLHLLRDDASFIRIPLGKIRQVTQLPDGS